MVTHNFLANIPSLTKIQSKKKFFFPNKSLFGNSFIQFPRSQQKWRTIHHPPLCNNMGTLKTTIKAFFGQFNFIFKNMMTSEVVLGSFNKHLSKIFSK